MKIKESLRFFPLVGIQGTSKVVLTFKGKFGQRPPPLRREWAKVNRKGRVSVCRGTTLVWVWSLGHGQVESGWAEQKVPVASHSPSSWSLKSSWVGGGVLSGLPGRGRERRTLKLTELVLWSPERRPRAGQGFHPTLPQLNKLSLNPIQFPCSPSNPHIFLK